MVKDCLVEWSFLDEMSMIKWGKCLSTSRSIILGILRHSHIPSRCYNSLCRCVAVRGEAGLCCLRNPNKTCWIARCCKVAPRGPHGAARGLNRGSRGPAGITLGFGLRSSHNQVLRMHSRRILRLNTCGSHGCVFACAAAG